MREIVHNGVILARLITADDSKPGLNFFCNDEDFLQVGTWCYGEETVLKAHAHNVVERAINRTQEAVVVVKGAVRATIYGEDGEPLERVDIGPGEALILLAGGHGYEIREPDTVVYEIKNGPYPGAEVDRRRISKR